MTQPSLAFASSSSSFHPTPVPCMLVSKWKRSQRPNQPPLPPVCPCRQRDVLAPRLFERMRRAASSSNSQGGGKEEEEDVFLQQELARLESLDEERQRPLKQRQGHSEATKPDEDDLLLFDNDERADWLLDDDFLLELLPDNDDMDDCANPQSQELEELERSLLLGVFPLEPMSLEDGTPLEEALKQGVVPADAGVGSGCLAGDFGFDPLGLSQKDYIGNVQRFIIRYLVPGGDRGDDDDVGRSNEISNSDRPLALILRDYREAEIRHGRLAMLAAVFWPLQEMADRLLLEDESFGSVIGNLFRGGITLPYFPLAMTVIMLLLGYLDIYSKAIKDMDKVGDAFLPGDCFWDPLKMLEGAPDRMKRNMQERELFNARAAMLAIAVYVWEEVITKQPLITVPGNELVFEPAYQIPYIQQWLDSQFGAAVGGSTMPLSPPEESFVLQDYSLDDVSGME